MEGIESQNDQLRELNKELESFPIPSHMTCVSPLRAIIGYSGILEEDFHEKLDDDGKKVIWRYSENALERVF